tara:strand:- start:669 stop:1709 length:1041 start_codon:yes stop_codon:yes gene_type:complete
MAFSAIIKPSDYFNTKLYTGNGSSQTITGLNFEPSWVWIKSRSNTQNNYLYDAVRGASYQLYSDTNNAQNLDTGGVNSFTSDGFTMGSSGDNANGYSQVAWNWKANGAGAINEAGSINTIKTSASTTSGFSICQWTGTGANGTVGHGLGVAPKMIIFKNTNTATNWDVFHGSLANTQRLFLDESGAATTAANAFNSTSPTTAVFSVGTADNTNKSSSPMIAYCFADVQGFSKMGSYTGNGNADGAFIYTGFKPAFVMTKPSSGVGSWYMLDNKRANPFNVVTGRLEADGSGAENTGFTWCDFTSNGFKIRTTEGGINASGVTFIYMAFAETPFVANSGESIPTTAR